VCPLPGTIELPGVFETQGPWAGGSAALFSQARPLRSSPFAGKAAVFFTRVVEVCVTSWFSGNRQLVGVTKKTSAAGSLAPPWPRKKF